MRRPALLLALATLILTACTSPPNRGRDAGRIDPSNDARTDGPALRSYDLVTATDQMVQDILGRPDINDPESPPRIYVGAIENQTSRPEQNYQIFLNRLRAQLLSSGARQGVEMRRERDFVERERERELAGRDAENTAESYRSKNEYVLTCIVQDLPSGGSDYYMLEYQLVQLVERADSGPDIGSGVIVWSGMYEVKYP